MTVQAGTTLRNAWLDAIETTVGTSAKLQIRSGTQPATCATADSGTLLCELTLPSNWMNDASGGTKTLAGSWTGTGAAAGTAGHYRLKDSTGTTCHMQGSVTATGGGGDLTLDNTSIAVSQAVSISSWTFTAGGA